MIYLSGTDICAGQIYDLRSLCFGLYNNSLIPVMSSSIPNAFFNNVISILLLSHAHMAAATQPANMAGHIFL